MGRCLINGAMPNSGTLPAVEMFAGLIVRFGIRMIVADFG